jgi:hypothetical protein
MSEVKCMIGSSTANPCPRPGTAPFWEDDPAGVKVCEVHAALQPLEGEVRDLTLALETLVELEECAREFDNQPLRGLVERGKREFSERLSLLEEHTQTISRASLG